MAENKNPSLAELNEAIAREHGIDPSSLKDYRLPEKPAGEPEPELINALHPPPALPLLHGIPNDGLAQTGGPPDGYRAQPREHPRAPSVVPMHTRDKASCFVWTPEQMLEEFLRAIRAGEETPEGMLIVYTERHPDGSVSVHSWRAKLGWCEEYTYLGAAQRKCLDGQRG